MWRMTSFRNPNKGMKWQLGRDPAATPIYRGSRAQPPSLINSEASAHKTGSGCTEHPPPEIKGSPHGTQQHQGCGRMLSPWSCNWKGKGTQAVMVTHGMEGILHLEQTLDPEQAESKQVPKMSKTISRLSVTSEGLCKTTSSSLGGKEPEVSKQHFAKIFVSSLCI